MGWRETYPKNARYRDRHPDRVKACKQRCAHKNKLLCLQQYGPSKEIRCSWPDCCIDDPDMLTIDHVANNGAEHRRHVGSGSRLYLWLNRNNFPEGYQTLCWNHQWKKQLTKGKASWL